MGATPQKLNDIEQALVHTLNWMEEYYRGHCAVMDVDFDRGDVILLGKENATQQFKNELDSIMLKYMISKRREHYA